MAGAPPPRPALPLLARLSLLITLLLLAIPQVKGHEPSQPDEDVEVWPMPQQMEISGRRIALQPSDFKVQTDYNAGSIFSRAFSSIYKRLFLLFNREPIKDESKVKVWGGQTHGLRITVASGDLDLHANVNETYILTLKDGISELSAETVYGVLHGLETLLQLYDPKTSSIPEGTVIDWPRFKHRGFLIDTARHYLPVEVILQHMDAMAMVKYNVLHWHIVDDQSFPYQSKAFPFLSILGAYNGAHIYKPEDIERVIDYGRHKGIRVIPEFDTPGHVQSIGKAIPSVLTKCFTDGRPDGTTGPLDVSKAETLTLVDTILKEISLQFEDSSLHLGGDEVDTACWDSNPDVSAWAKQNGIDDIQQYWELYLLQRAATLGKEPIFWEDAFRADGIDPEAQQIVFQLWRGMGTDAWQGTSEKITAAGFHVLLSAPWYLNKITNGEDWDNFYLIEPTNFTTSEGQKAMVLGGEACLWAEYVDSTNFMTRAWPSAAAIGERLWSDEDVRDVDAARERLINLRCKFIKLGLPAEPIGPGFCEYEFFPFELDQADWTLDEASLTIGGGVSCVILALLFGFAYYILSPTRKKQRPSSSRFGEQLLPGDIS